MSLPPGATLVSGSLPDASQLPPGATLVSGSLPGNQTSEEPGFLSKAWDKAVSMFPSKEEALRALGGSGVTAYHLATNPKEAFAKLAQESPGFAQAQEYERSRSTGAGVGRSALNAIGTMVGVDPAAEEAAAARGDTAGVLADAAVPAAAVIAGPLVGEGAARLTAGPITDALTNNKARIQSTAEALKKPAEIPGKVVSKLADLIPDKPVFPEPTLPSYEDYAMNRGAEMDQARAKQDVQIRRETAAKAAADRSAAKADAAARQPVPLTDSPNYQKWKADQAAAAQAAKDAAKAEAAARQPVPISQSPYYGQNQAATAAEEAARKPVPLNQSPYYGQNQDAAAEAARPAQPLRSIYGPPVPSTEDVQGAQPSLPTPRTPPTVSEGRPATWTNEKVKELAAWGDPDAVDQARARGFGTIPKKYSAVDLTPKSTTLFDAQGNPIPSGGVGQMADVLAGNLNNRMNAILKGGAGPEVEVGSGSRVNASGESSASQEAISRMNNEKAAGVKYYRENPGGGRTELTAADRVDARAYRPGEKIIRKNADGSETVLDEGSARPGAIRTRKPQ